MRAGCFGARQTFSGMVLTRDEETLVNLILRCVGNR